MLPFDISKTTVQGIQSGNKPTEIDEITPTPHVHTTFQELFNYIFHTIFYKLKHAARIT